MFMIAVASYFFMSLKLVYQLTQHLNREAKQQSPITGIPYRIHSKEIHNRMLCSFRAWSRFSMIFLEERSSQLSTFFGIELFHK